MTRDNNIDYLRFLGLSLIVLAHVNAPFILTQIICFVVPLMVFISGLSISGKNIFNYWQFAWKRTKRLVVPVWLFLSLYLFSFYFIQSAILPEKYLSVEMIVRSFLLLDNSIGYVWIIRVFLLVMLVTPLIIKISNGLRSNLSFLIFLLFLLVLNQGLYQLSSIIGLNCVRFILGDYIIYCVAYSFPFSIGIRLRHASNKTLFVFVCFLFILFLLLGINCYVSGNNPIGIDRFKYPPRPYYIVYGSLISTILWSTRKCWKSLAQNPFVVFVGTNSLWIYLWHMPFALLATALLNNWLIKYCVVYGSALLLFWLQYRIVIKMNKITLSKYLLG